MKRRTLITAAAVTLAAPMIGAQSPDVLNNQAVSLSKLGKLTQAVETLRRGLRLDPGHPDCLYNLVQLEKRHGRIGHMEAMRRLKQARAYYPLALLSIEEGMPNDAFDLLKGLNPDDLPSPGLVHRATGDALMYLGDFPGAERSYAHAHELMPKDAMAEHRKTLAAERGKDRAGAIYFPSPDPYQIDRSGDRSLRLLLDHGAEGLVGLTQGAAVYLTLSGGEPLVVERSANCGPATRTWIHGQHLAVADSQGFEFRQVPSMRLLTRRAGRILACSPQLDRVVTLEQAGPHLVLVEKGQFLPIKMEGQRPDQGPLLAVFDSSGKHLRLLLPSGQLAALDEENRAVVQSWPPHIEGHKEAKCMALTGDGALLLGFANGTVQGFSLKHQKMEFTSRLPDPPRTIEVHAGGSRIVVRTMRGFLILSRSGDLILSGDGPLAIDPQGRRALFFFKGRQVMYNLNPLHVLRRWSRVMEHPKSVAFSGDGRMAVALSADGEYLVWEMDEPHRVYQRELLMSPGRSYAEILSADEQFQRHLDLARQALGRGEQQESHRHLQRARRVPGYGQGAAALNFNWQLLESLKRDQLEAVWERLSIEGANPGDLDLAPEGRQLLFSFGNKACLSEEDEGGNRPIWTLTRRGQVRLLRFVQIAPDRKEILIADESGEVGLHDPADGRLKQTIKLEGGPLAHVMLHGISLTYLCKAGGLGTFFLPSGLSFSSPSSSTTAATRSATT